jgi:HKD family nuclease
MTGVRARSLQKLSMAEMTFEYQPSFYLNQNPYVLGCVLFRSIYMDLEKSHQDLVLSFMSYSRLLCFTYHGLKQTENLPEIPLLETFMQLYGSKFLGGTYPTRGQFLTKFIHVHPQGHLVKRTVADQDNTPVNAKNLSKQFKQQQTYDLGASILSRQMSSAINFMFQKDYEKMQQLDSSVNKENPQSNSSSSSLLRDLIDKVERHFEYELFGNRYLSLDHVLMFDKIYFFCQDMVMKIPFIFQAFVTTAPQFFEIEKIMEKGSQLEIFIVPLLMELLDMSPKRPDPAHEELLQQLKDMLLKHFCEPNKDDIEKNFIFPATPKFDLETAFGTAAQTTLSSSSSSSSSTSSMEVFSKLMDELDALLLNRVNLSQEEIQVYSARIKESCKSDPPLVSHYRKQESFTGRMTLLDHAISGAIKDLGLSEWIIAMGGLQLFFSREAIPDHGELPEDFPSQLLSACKYGDFEGICLLLCETVGKTINYQNKLDGNTALHYLFQRILSFEDFPRLQLHWILQFTAIKNLRNNEGKSVADCTASCPDLNYLGERIQKGQTGIHRWGDGSGERKTVGKQQQQQPYRVHEISAPTEIGQGGNTLGKEEKERKALEAAEELLKWVEKEEEREQAKKKQGGKKKKR